MNKKLPTLLATATVLTNLIIGSEDVSAVYVKCPDPASSYYNAQYNLWAANCSIQPHQSQCNMGCYVYTNKEKTEYLTSVIFENYKPCIEQGGKIVLTVPDNPLFPSLTCSKSVEMNKPLQKPSELKQEQQKQEQIKKEAPKR